MNRRTKQYLKKQLRCSDWGRIAALLRGCTTRHTPPKAGHGYDLGDTDTGVWLHIRRTSRRPPVVYLPDKVLTAWPTLSDPLAQRRVINYKGPIEIRGIDHLAAVIKFAKKVQ